KGGIMNAKLILSLITTVGVVGIAQTPTFAHGKAEHGGRLTEVQEYTFEVVSKEQGEEKEEKAEREKQPHTEKMSFTVYVKDPNLKPVTSGNGSLKISEGKKEVANAPLAASDNAFNTSATLPHHGRYRAAIDFTPPGKRPLKASFPIDVD